MLLCMKPKEQTFKRNLLVGEKLIRYWSVVAKGSLRREVELVPIISLSFSGFNNFGDVGKKRDFWLKFNLSMFPP